MTSPLDTGNRWAGLGCTLGLLTVAAAIADGTPALALVNESPSLPRGVYVLVPGGRAETGAIVAVPQPSRARAYLRRLGMPAEVRLIKRVAAAEGDRVCRTGAVVRAGARSATVVGRDRRGVALPAWNGCLRLEAGELFLLGDTASSFDSRYFGPVRVEAVEGVYREAVTW